MNDFYLGVLALDLHFWLHFDNHVTLALQASLVVCGKFLMFHYQKLVVIVPLFGI